MPPLTTTSPYLLLLIAGLAFILVSAILAALLPLPLALIGAELLCLLTPALLFRRAFAPPAGGWPGLMPAQPVWWCVAGVIAALPLGLALNALASMSAHLSPALAEQAAAYSQQTRALILEGPTWRVIAAHLSVIAFAPITEELLFRGAMLPAQRARLGVGAACLINGALFGAFHFNWLVLLPLTALGAYLAWLTLRTRSVLPAILGHAAMNGASVLIMHNTPATPPATVPLAELLAPLGVGGVSAALMIFALAQTARD